MIFLLACCWLTGCAGNDRFQDSGVAFQRFEFRSVIMASEASVVLYASDEEAARGHAAAAFDRMNRLDAVMSDYRVDSELMRLADLAYRGGDREPHKISEDLFRVLWKSIRIAEASGGAFDPTIGAYSLLWREARAAGSPPSDGRLDEAAARVGWEAVRLDRRSQAVAFDRPQIRLDLGGIGKGFAVDEALAVLRARGVERAMVRLGGDIAVGSAPPGSEGWRIGLPGGDRPIVIEHAGVSTSGDSHQHLDAGGRRYSHIIDPQTGRGLVWSETVSVVAADAATADALATAISVLRARGESHEGLLDAFPGTRVFVSESEPAEPEPGS